MGTDGHVATPVQLVFDTNILVDALTARGHYYEYAVQVLEMVQRGEVEGWYAPHTLTTVYYLVEKTLGMQAQTRAQAGEAAQAVVKRMLGILKPLPQVGNEFLELEGQAGDDLEDLLIVKLSGRYLPNPVIVTRDKWMLIADRSWEAAHPKELIEGGLVPWAKRSEKLPTQFIDLHSQQRAVWPRLQTNIQNVLRHGRYIMGPEVRELEEKLADYVGVTHCVAVSSGTDSLFIAMLALGVGVGDEVITTPFTFIATGEMIALLSAKPVFVDIDPQTYNIDPKLLEAAITSKTKAIMPVSLYGQCADFDAINAIAKTHGLPVIEDGAQSFGATYKGQKSCGLSTIGATSFFPSKPLGGYGDGGALFTNDDALAKAMREIRVHGQDRRYHHPRIGVNGRIDTLQAAILLAKLERIDWEVQRRHEIGARYTELLTFSSETQPPSPLRGGGQGWGATMTPPFIESHNTSVYAQYTIQVDHRDELCRSLNEAGIPTAVHYPVPLHLQAAFAGFGYQPGDFPVAEAAAKRVMSLPMGPDLGEEDQARVARAVMDAGGNPWI